jgi:NADPH-dependent glutamate synthase beta subunit-like oxidoreductase
VNKSHQTSLPKVFATGDSISGASLVVTAIMSGRRAAVSIMEHLEGYSMINSLNGTGKLKTAE